ncbi:hypothetical protein Taro_050361, partial [Colocasia esculenta]|nr:hypothetical protein [Colocasia esculenta]
SSSSSSESSQPPEVTPSKSISEGKTILKPRTVDLADKELVAAFPEILEFFNFQSWLPFISQFRTIYPRLVQEFCLNVECTDEGYKSEVKGVKIDMPIALAATLFKAPAEGTDYHNFEFDLHEAYSILTGFPSDESDPRQTHVTKFNTNTFPPVLRIIHHILTTIITPQGGGRDRLTDIQRFVIYCMKKNLKINIHVIMYQIISETTRKDLHRSLPYAAHLTPVFEHFGVSLENEKSQSIPKSNIYCFKHLQKFMGFRLEGDQVRRGPVVEAPVAPEDQPPVHEDQPPVHEDKPPVHEDQPPVHEDQPQIREDQPLAPEDQPPVGNDSQLPQDAPLTPPFQTSSPIHHSMDFSQAQAPAQTSSAFGGPSVPPELYSFLNDKFNAFTTSIQQMLESFDLKVDTLRKLCDLKFLLDTWHSRGLVDRPWIMCPRPPRVILDILGINSLLIDHPTIESLQEPYRNPFGGRESSPPYSCSPCASPTRFPHLQAQEVVGLRGPRDWAKNTHWFSVCERDRAGHHVLNATVQSVVFLLPPFGVVRLHARRVAHAGQLAGVRDEKAMAYTVTFWLRWQGPNRAQQALLGQEEGLAGGFG